MFTANCKVHHRSRQTMIFKRGNRAKNHNDDSLVPTIPVVDHKVQKPNRDGPDPFASAPLQRSEGSIGVGANTPKSGIAGILKQSSHSPTPGTNADDSSLESIGVIDGFHNTATNNKNDIDDPIIVDRLEVNGNDNDTYAASTILSATPSEKRRRVRWGAGVKAPKHGCGSGMVGLTNMYQGLISNLDQSAQRLNKGLEGLGMKCVGGGRVLCGACGSSVTNCRDGSVLGACRCSNCGLGEGAVETNDLASADQEEQPQDEQTQMLVETRNAIQESRDAIVASHNALMDSYTEMRETRQCVEESRDVMNGCREAIIQSNNIAVLAKEEELMKVTGGKAFTFDNLGRAIASDKDVERRRDGGGMYYEPSAIEKYRHSSSRASINNVEAGMGDNVVNVVSSYGGATHVVEDPFSASMHAHQRSPRVAGSPRGAAVPPPTPSSPKGDNAKVPTSILKKNRRRAGHNNAAAQQQRSTPSHPTTRIASRAVRRRGVGTSHNKTFTTKNVSVKRQTHTKHEEQHEAPAAQDQQQHRHGKKKKKGSVSRLVIGGLKKPLKFMSHGVKAHMKTRSGPRRVLALTTAAEPPTSPRQHQKKTHAHTEGGTSSGTRRRRRHHRE